MYLCNHIYVYIHISSSILGSFLLFSVAKQGPMVLAEGNGVAGGRTGHHERSSYWVDEHRDLVAPSEKNMPKIPWKAGHGENITERAFWKYGWHFFWGGSSWLLGCWTACLYWTWSVCSSRVLVFDPIQLALIGYPAIAWMGFQVTRTFEGCTPKTAILRPKKVTQNSCFSIFLRDCHTEFGNLGLLAKTAEEVPDPLPM